MGMKVTAVMKEKAGTARRLRAHNDRVRVLAATANEIAADKLLELARDRCPVDTGALKESGRVTTRDYGWAVKFQVGFGGNDPDFSVVRESTHPLRRGRVRRFPFRYAARVNESTGYLSIPLLQDQQVLRQVLRQAADIAKGALPWGSP